LALRHGERAKVVVSGSDIVRPLGAGGQVASLAAGLGGTDRRQSKSPSDAIALRGEQSPVALVGFLQVMVDFVGCLVNRLMQANVRQVPASTLGKLGAGPEQPVPAVDEGGSEPDLSVAAKAGGLAVVPQLPGGRRLSKEQVRADQPAVEIRIVPGQPLLVQVPQVVPVPALGPLQDVGHERLPMLPR